MVCAPGPPCRAPGSSACAAIMSRRSPPGRPSRPTPVECGSGCPDAPGSPSASGSAPGAGVTGTGAASARAASPAGGARMSSGWPAAAACRSARPGTVSAGVCGPGAGMSGNRPAVPVFPWLAPASPACGASPLRAPPVPVRPASATRPAAMAPAAGGPSAAPPCSPGGRTGGAVRSGWLFRHHSGCAGSDRGRCVRAGALSSRAGRTRSRSVAKAAGAAGESGPGPGMAA